MPTKRYNHDFERLSLEGKARVEAIKARRATPAASAEDQEAREQIAREIRESGTIKLSGDLADIDDLVALRRFLEKLRVARVEKGLSLDDMAKRSGIERSALNKLETGKNLNPMTHTLARYVRALGRRITWATEEAKSESVSDLSLALRRIATSS